MKNKNKNKSKNKKFFALLNHQHKFTLLKIGKNTIIIQRKKKKLVANYFD